MNLHTTVSARLDLGALETGGSAFNPDDATLEAAVLGPMNVTVVGRTCAGSCRHVEAQGFEDSALEFTAGMQMNGPTGCRSAWTGCPHTAPVRIGDDSLEAAGLTRLASPSRRHLADTTCLAAPAAGDDSLEQTATANPMSMSPRQPMCHGDDL
jgi:hypothetical protein